MKEFFRHFLVAALLASVALSFSACGSVNKKLNSLDETIQLALNVFVPKDFYGDFVLDQSMTSVGFDIRLVGLHWVEENKRWSYSGLDYDRNGFWTKGAVRLEPKPRPSSMRESPPLEQE